MRIFTAALFAITITSGAVSAQTFPDPRNTAVNDYADMLPDEAEARITEVLDDLTADTGADATIVTLSSVRFYAQNLTVAIQQCRTMHLAGQSDAGNQRGVIRARRVQYRNRMLNRPDPVMRVLLAPSGMGSRHVQRRIRTAKRCA